MNNDLVWPGEAVEAENARAELAAIRRGERITSYGSCRNKLRHETKADAESAARKLAERDQERGSNRSVRVYACNVCGFWHLTSKRLRDGEAAS